MRSLFRFALGVSLGIGFMLISIGQVCADTTDVALAASEEEGEGKTILFIGSARENHPPATHEYMAGLRILAVCLEDVPQLEIKIVEVDVEADWEEGPDLIAEADGVVLFLHQGARWIHTDVDRLRALAELAGRGGAILGLHYGIGTTENRHVDGFQKLLGGCHGGPDRKFAELETVLSPTDEEHPILRGVERLTVTDEFYYQLKFIDPSDSITPLLTATIEEKEEVVAWAWERPGKGRSFGFSGLHFHSNWSELAYRRICSQAVLWTLDLPIPEGGLPCEITEADLALPAESP